MGAQTTGRGACQDADAVETDRRTDAAQKEAWATQPARSRGRSREQCEGGGGSQWKQRREDGAEQSRAEQSRAEQSKRAAAERGEQQREMDQELCKGHGSTAAAGLGGTTANGAWRR